MTAAAFIARTAPERFVWGVNDCALWAAALVAEQTGTDPAQALRGTYATWRECRLIQMRAGGLLALSRRLMAAHEAGADGDGVCVVRTGGRVLAGIISGGRVFLKSDPGVISPHDCDILERWAI